MSVDSKIEGLIEEFTLNPTALKTMGLAGLGGSIGAGLDLYFGGAVDFKDFIKPMGAWGLGGSVGALSALGSDNKKDPIDPREIIEPKSTIKGKDIDEQYYHKA